MGSPPKPQIRECRLIVDAAADGAWNMALDEALLESAAGHKQWTLRFYQWSRPTLSLGYFQELAARSEQPASLAAEVIRRSTGGGAILHDHELTYSFTLPASGHDRGHLEWLYYAMHESLIDALAELGVGAGLQPRDAHDPSSTAFLCFCRRTRGDVLLAAVQNAPAWKIAGSAQRRSKGAVLQHGSVLLRTSAHAPDLPGIAQIVDRQVSPMKLQRAWIPRIRDRLHLHYHATQPTKHEKARARQLVADKFAHPAWTARR